MNKPLLVTKILAPFVLVALIIGIGGLHVLYKELIEERRASLLRLAATNAELINAVAEYDQTHTLEKGDGAAFTATLSQLRNAFGTLTTLDAAGELLIVRRSGDKIDILIHQNTRHLGEDHPAHLHISDGYAQPMLEALAGRSGTTWTKDSHDREVLIAYAPAPAMGVAVMIEVHRDELLAPFISTAVMLVTIGIAAIAVAASFTYSQTVRVVENALFDRKQSIEALEKAEEAQRTLEHALKSTGEGFALFDAEDRLVACNDVYRDIYKSHSDAIKPGNRFEDILRTGLSRGAFPDAIGVEEIWLADRLREHKKTRSKIEQQVGDRWLLISEHRTEDGGTVGVRTDITELKNKERELRESEKRFRDFTLTASDWVWETDPEHRIKRTSIRTDEVPSFDLNSILGKRRSEFAAEETDNFKWRKHNETLEARLPFRDFQYQIALDKDRVRTISISGVPIYDDDGQFCGYRGTGRDLTDIIESRERFRVAFESVTVGIIFADERGVIEGFNPEAERIFGYHADEVLGRNVSTLMPNPDRERHHSYMNNYLGGGPAQIIGKGREVKGLNKDGTVFPMNLGIAEMNVQGRRHFIASITDLTVEHALEHQLRRSQKMEAIGQLTGGVAHDFNNLLGIIVGNLDLARRRLEGDSPVAKFVGKAMTAAERGATLTRRLLNFSRQAPEENAPIIINHVLRDLRDLIGKSITSKISFELVLEEAIPTVQLNQGDFEDAVINLALNARDAMPDGGQLIIETRVTHIDDLPPPAIQRVPSGDYVELIISDDGVGMNADLTDQIFQPFFTTKDQGKGTGLGLAMVYGFVKRSGGYISVYSELGLGTTFRIYLPIAPTVMQTASNSSFDTAAEPKSGDETILIVDDEQQLAEVASSVLEEYGYTTLVAHSGIEGLEVLKDHPEIDMVFTDIVMPGGMNGMELGDQARELRPEIAILTCSGFTAGILHERGEDKPIYPMISKPYNNRELANAIRTTLDQAAES
ncbi:MAG: PAS domain S-box protein [Thalassospira sp.]|uniref:PAS domain S-box protein n=1 Tax=Thalassospira sp. TaxID=1912094 RepID=UPI003A853E60